jgi:general nucleoside transport system ATP-binding protein
VNPGSPSLSLRAIRKTYPGVVAVDDVDLDLYPGEIHALVGENGAGKSTLSAVAFGEVRADAGSVHAIGTVGLVHQHFQLIGRLTVWQNVLLAREPRHGWRIDERAARERVAGLAQRNGLEIDPDALVETLPVGVQQRVELLRELDRNPRVLLLDEPTAALAPAEIDAFFSTIAALARGGTAVMIVTHKLQEVISFADRVSVMRRGRIVEQVAANQTSVAEIARAMVGGEVPSIATRESVAHAPCVSINNLSAQSGASRIENFTLEIASGEIVGVAGVEGNGQTALADALCELTPYSGSVLLPQRRGVIPQDRRVEALVMSWSIVQNTILGRQNGPRLRHGASIDYARAREDARLIAEHYDVRAASLDVAVRTLSGGNQQKVVVGRALLDDPQFLLAYNPTRGIDVGSASLVQSRLVEARNRGTSILLISFDLDEILAVSDRVVVLYRGAIAGLFDRPRADRATIGRLMAGAAA